MSTPTLTSESAPHAGYQPGQELLGYRLVERVGVGGFGEVWRAVPGPGVSGPQVALKIAHAGYEQAYLEALEKEARLQQRVDHPAVVKVLAVHLDHAPPVIVQQFISGQSLRQRLTDQGPFPPGRALRLFRQILEPLEHVHSLGIAHGDLKPENILLRRDGQVFLTDFGLGQSWVEEEETRSRVRLSVGLETEVAWGGGTPAYLSPERRAGEKPDAASDIFALGVLLCEMVTGQLPHGRDLPSELKKSGRYVPGSTREQAVLELVDRLFEQTYTRRGHRFASVKEMQRALEAGSRQLAVRFKKPRLRYRFSTTVRRGGLLAALLGLAVGLPVLVASQVPTPIIAGLCLLVGFGLWVGLSPELGAPRDRARIPFALVLFLLLGILSLGTCLMSPSQQVKPTGIDLDRWDQSPQKGSTMAAEQPFDDDARFSRRPGDRVLGYVLVRGLGTGGTAEVWQAADAVRGRHLTVKLPTDRDPSLFQQSLAAARLQEGLDHPGIQRVLAVSEEPAAVVLEYVAGESLRQRLARRVLPPREALDILDQLACALDYAHRRGVPHGDLKPGNVLLDDEGGVYLTDFGSTDIARLYKSRLLLSRELETQAVSARFGTIPYLAPERLRGEAADGPADVYSLAILLCEMVTGQLPEGRDMPSRLARRRGIAVGGFAWRAIDRLFDHCFTGRDRRFTAADIATELAALPLARSRPPASPAHYVADWSRSPHGRLRRPQYLGLVGITVALAAFFLAQLVLLAGTWQHDEPLVKKRIHWPAPPAARVEVSRQQAIPAFPPDAFARFRAVWRQRQQPEASRQNHAAAVPAPGEVVADTCRRPGFGRSILRSVVPGEHGR